MVLTCVTTGRPREVQTALVTVLYQHVKPSLFFGYAPKGAYDLALPQKAALDWVYLRLQNRQPIALDEWDWHSLSIKRIRSMAQKYPKSVLQGIYNTVRAH